jgi:uncharacterized protein with GYD domain
MIYLSLFKPKGKGEEAVKYLRELKAAEGVTIRGVYFTFGQYDAAVLFEAPNEKKAMDFVMEVGFATGYTVETMAAVSAKEV